MDIDKLAQAYSEMGVSAEDAAARLDGFLPYARRWIETIMQMTPEQLREALAAIAQERE